MRKLISVLLSILLILSIFSNLPGYSNRAQAVAESDPPITNHVLSGKVAPNGIYYGTVGVQLSAIDYGSGVASTQYSVDGGSTWRTYSQPVLFTDKKVHRVLYRSIDQNGNTELAKTVEFTIKQDTEPPESSLSFSGVSGQNTYFVGPVSFSIEAEDVHSEVNYREYSLDGGNTWIAYSSPIQMVEEQNTVIYYRSADINGNVEKMRKAKVNIDLTPPTKPDLISNPSEWSNSQFTVMLIDGVDGQSGTQGSQYRIGETGNWSNYSNPLPVSGTGIVKVYARTADYAGNVSEITEHELKFDVTAPTVPEIESSAEDWSNTEVYVSLIPGVDTESQVRGIHYKTGTDLEWTEYVDPFGIFEEGITSIYARTVDWAGNDSATTESVVKIDLTAPAAPSFSPASEDWTNQDVLLQIIPGQDSLSGAESSRYKFDDAEEWLLYEEPLSFTDEGVTIVHAFTYDKAGNASEDSSHAVRIDKTPPTAPILAPSTTDWTNQDVLVTLTSGEDELSGVNRNEYRINAAGNWVTYTEPFTMSDEGDFIVYARTVDEAGNISSMTETTVKIDKTAPSAPASVFKISQIGSTVLLRWTPSTDALSGVEGYEIYNGGQLLATSTGNKIQLTNLQTNMKYSITVKAVDRADNRSLPNSHPAIFYTNEPSIVGGRSHNFVWNQQGTVRGWGSNSYGQLGDGTRTAKYSPILLSSLQGFTMIATGVRDNIGLRPDGTVWKWGENAAGQVMAPTKVEGLANVVSISMGITHYMALKEDGTVWAWGDNFSGMLGDGTTDYRSTPVQVVGLSSIVAIANGYYHSMALREDGTVWVWGANGRGQLGINAGSAHQQWVPIQVSGLSDVIQISTEYMHSAALRSDGTVWTWGFNDYGQLGNGIEDVDSLTPVKVENLTGVIKLSASYAHNLALTEDGNVWAWGDNYYGEIGDGTTVQRKTPVKVAHLEGITDIFDGEFYSLAVKRNGSVWSWGNNLLGQLGDGTTVNKTTRNLVGGIPYPADTLAPTVPGSLRAAGKTSTSVIFQDWFAPTVPEKLKVSRSGENLVLEWDESKDNIGVKGYQIYVNDVKVADSENTSATLSQPDKGKLINITVKAVDTSGNVSEASIPVTP